MFIVQKRDWRSKFGSYQHLPIKVVGLELIIKGKTVDRDGKRAEA